MPIRTYILGVMLVTLAMLDPRAHLRKKLRFHRGKNRSSSSPGYVEENDWIFPSIRWELTRLSGFLPHRLPFHARDTADALSQKDLFIQVLGQTVMLCSNAHAGPCWEGVRRMPWRKGGGIVWVLEASEETPSAVPCMLWSPRCSS